MPMGPHNGPEITPSQRKLKALARLRGLAAKLTDGTDYNLQQHILADVTLDQMRKDLSGIRGSLVDTVIDERAR